MWCCDLKSHTECKHAAAVRRYLHAESRWLSNSACASFAQTSISRLGRLFFKRGSRYAIRLSALRKINEPASSRYRICRSRSCLTLTFYTPFSNGAECAVMRYVRFGERNSRRDHRRRARAYRARISSLRERVTRAQLTRCKIHTHYAPRR